MKAAEADLLIIPDRGNADADHWQSRWEAKLSTARRVEQADWHTPDADAWAGAVVDAVTEATRPVVFVAHGLGVAAVVSAAPRLPAGKVAAAFFVGPRDVEPDGPASAEEQGFGPLSRDPLPFPSMLIASRTSLACSYDMADEYGHAWGSFVIDAGDVGAINSTTGHGPWPEGSLTFARFLSSIRRAT